MAGVWLRWGAEDEDPGAPEQVYVHGIPRKFENPSSQQSPS